MNKCFSFTRKALLVELVSALAVASHAAPQTGTMTDTRDGKKYKTVQIGEQVWMAENLNYKTKMESWCYDNKESNCVKYGRLYTWKSASNACPSSWHLPSKDEFEILISEAGGAEFAGKKLKSKKGWKSKGGKGGNGTDAVGFAALPAGSIVTGGDFDEGGLNAYFWSATGNSINLTGIVMELWFFDDNADLQDTEGEGFSVRCVKD